MSVLIVFPVGRSGAIERNCFISPDLVNSLTSELPYIDRRMSVLFVVFPVGRSGAIERNCLISPDFVNSLTSELPYIEECQHFLSFFQLVVVVPQKGVILFLLTWSTV